MFGLGRHLVSGTVVDKKTYPGQPEKPGYFFSTKGTASVWIPPTQATPDGYVLVVDGTDQHGKEMKGHEVFVDGLEYSTTPIPSPYIPKEKHK
jgi:hypothetical protein